MKAIFLSDAHLQGNQAGRQQRLIAFLDSLLGSGERNGGRSAASSAPDQLILAGDFFDFWFSRNGIIYPGFAAAVKRLTLLKQSGIRISLCEGNHDFFLADYFTGKLGMDVYPDAADLAFDGLRILVAHGDTVDRSNRRYLALRRFLRSPFCFFLQRVLPLPLLWGIARLSSELSKEASGESYDELAEVMYRFALGKFAEGYDAVVLGHCHLPLLREVSCDGRPRTFATLGDWIAHESYLYYEDGRFAMKRYTAEG
jgi:UDP-2,3-diacylglucosamine hydrolase